MMQFQRPLIFIVAAQLTLAAFVLNSFGFNYAPSFGYRFYDIFPSVSINPGVFLPCPHELIIP